MDLQYVEWSAAAAGVIGTLLLAARGPRAGWGFVWYLASNAGWILFAIGNGHDGLLVQQIAFTITSGLGIYTWLWRAPPVEPDAGETLIPGGDVYLQLLEAHARIAELEQLAHGKKP